MSTLRRGWSLLLHDPLFPARACLLSVGTLLLSQGLASLLARAFWAGGAEATHGLLSADSAHGLLHVAWGLLLLAGLTGWGGMPSTPAAQAWLLAIFGAFYLGLALLGVLVHHPLGLHLNGGENVFHTIVGAGAALCAWRAWAPAGASAARGRAAARRP